MTPKGEAKSRSPHWCYVWAAYRAMGIDADLDTETLPDPYGMVYCNRRVALGGDAFEDLGLGLHDLAHYLVCPDRRRDAPNFGLGGHPTAIELYPVEPLLAEKATFVEEADASWVNVLLCRALLGPAVAEETAKALGFLKGMRSHVFGRGTDARLRRRGMLTPDGSFVLPAELADLVRAQGTMIGAAFP